MIDRADFGIDYGNGFSMQVKLLISVEELAEGGDGTRFSTGTNITTNRRDRCGHNITGAVNFYVQIYVQFSHIHFSFGACRQSQRGIANTS